MNPTASVPPAAEKMFRKTGMRDSALLLLLAWTTPLAIQSIPWEGPLLLGAYLLPMFWAETIAVYLYGLGLGLLVGLSTPFVVFTVAGFPDPSRVVMLAFELTAFALVTRIFIKQAPTFRWGAPVSFLIARLITLALQASISALGLDRDFSSSFRELVMALQVALPGLFILTVIHFSLVRALPKPDDWDAP